MSSDFDAPSGTSAPFAAPPPPDTSELAPVPPPPQSAAPIPPPPGARVTPVPPPPPAAAAHIAPTPTPAPPAPASVAPLPTFTPTPTPAPPVAVVETPPAPARVLPTTERLPLLDTTSPANVSPPAQPQRPSPPPASAPTPPAPQPVASNPAPAPVAAAAPPAQPAPLEPAGPSTGDPDSAERHDLSGILSQLTDAPAEAAPTPEVGADLTDARDLERPSSASKIVIVPEGGLDFDPSFASFGRRAIGLVIDTAIIGVAVIPGLLLAVASSSLLVILLGLALMLVGFCVVLVISSKAIANSKQWIGNRVTGTSVVDAVNGSNLTLANAISRNFVRHLISPVLLAGFILAFADGQRRTLHDRIVTSVVTGRQREVWTADDGGPNARSPQH